ncbi:hypothetical protein Ndes2526B_g06776 [Nannochloris sp. 'desiccata']|nr:hypothetical protein KSW81_005115 [Chlorella desiccata (nom. nud.)]KAH7617887.1 hypothetical protein NADE_000091 [Chlorella desiccata (nom. nud.)]
MASFTLSGLTSVAAFATRQQRPARQSRGVQKCFAMASEDEKKLTFESNKRSALGFTESDSAGQTNIFAVEPKAYVAGSSKDMTSDAGNSTAGAAAIAGTFAVGAVIGGLLLVKDSAPILEDYPTEYLTLAEYKAEFAADFKMASAPTPAINES